MLRFSSCTLITALTLSATAPAAVADTPSPVAAQIAKHDATSSSRAHPRAEPRDAVRYATRDAGHRADKFTGGSFVVIGVSGTAVLIALLVVLILL